MIAPRHELTDEERADVRRVEAALEALRTGPDPPTPLTRGPVEVVLRRTEDHVGDPAFDIVILLDDSATDEDLRWPNLQPIHTVVFDSLLDEQASRWPYIRFGTRTDYWKARLEPENYFADYTVD